MRTIVALAVCSACGGGDSASIDAAVGGDAVVIDASIIDGRLPTCAASSFTTSAQVSPLNTATSETFLRLSSDELTAYFAHQNPDEMLYVATRPSTTAPFSAPATLTITGNGTLETTSPTVTADGLTLYFTSSRTGTLGGRDIWRATRAVTTTNFGSITQLTALSSVSSENDVFVLPDHSAIYFSSNRGDAIYRIYRAEIQGTGFGAPEAVFDEAPASVSRVAVAPDELTMVYSTGSDLRLSVRASPTVSWLPGVAMAAIDSTSNDVPYWISDDLCRLYYGSNRSGDYDFRVAVRTPQ
jgi:hypothetical protein